jgi:hypothetical protein
MDKFLPQWLDGYFRRHPIVMMSCIAVLALVVTLMLLAQSSREIVVYATF